MTTPVDELDLPEIDIFALDRQGALAAFEQARDQH